MFVTLFGFLKRRTAAYLRLAAQSGGEVETAGAWVLKHCVQIATSESLTSSQNLLTGPVSGFFTTHPA